jgi:hypothetical protein
LFVAAEARWVGWVGFVYSPYFQGYDRDVQAVKDQLDDQLFEEAVAEGRAMSAAQAMAYALGEA